MEAVKMRNEMDNLLAERQVMLDNIQEHKSYSEMLSQQLVASASRENRYKMLLIGIRDMLKEAGLE